MRALVTGISGFAGSHLAEHLLDCGDEVSGFVRDPARARNLSSVASRLTLFVGDAADPDALSRALEGARPDRIYHLAGFPSVRLSFEDPVGCFRVNALGTLALLEAVKRLGARPRVLVVSSGEAYGRAGSAPIPETTPLDPLSPYGVSKAAAEAVAVMAGKTMGISVIRARSFNHVGPRQAPAFAAPAFARQVALAELGRAPPEIRAGNLEPLRDISDVRDVARAYRLLLERGVPGEVYNVATGRAIAIREVVERLAARARVPIRIVEDPALFREVDIECLLGDARRFELATGMRLDRPLDDSLDALLTDWRRRATAPAA